MNDTKPIDYVESSFIIQHIFGTTAPGRERTSPYGSKIPTHRKVLCADGRTRRIYARCFSNVASHYIIVSGVQKLIREVDLH